MLEKESRERPYDLPGSNCGVMRVSKNVQPVIRNSPAPTSLRLCTPWGYSLEFENCWHSDLRVLQEKMFM